MHTVARALASLVVGICIIAGTVLAAAITTPATAESRVAVSAPPAVPAVSVVSTERDVAAEVVADAATAVEAAEEARKAAATEQAQKAKAVEESRTSSEGLVLTCEPHADARVVGNWIVNKDCPALNAAKEQAQREYAQQLADEAAGYPMGGAAGLQAEREAQDDYWAKVDAGLID